MRLFGLEVRKAAPMAASAVSDSRGWVQIIREGFAGAWQRNEEWTTDTVLAHHAVYSCITLIASDVGKLRPKLVQRDADGIWFETESSAFSPVLRKPNRYQNHIQFKEWWVTSKLIRGNTYVLLERDNRGIVTDLYLLDPSRVKVLVAPDGEVFYELGQDNLSGLQATTVTVPASEILHDRMNCLFHPLVGVSPIFASGMAANVGLKIANNAAKFFGRGSNPSGVVSAPSKISKETAERLSEAWNANYSGDNSGRVAVLGEGLKFEPMRMTAVDSQTIQHLKWTAETVCATFHVPPFKVNLGQSPTYQNAEIMNQIYYSDCLQSHIESMEAVLDEGLGLTTAKSGKLLGVELDLDGLLRMDTATLVETLGKGVTTGIMSPNDARRRVDLPPVKGGDTPYLQQQNYSLSALDERDRAGPAPSDTGRQPASAPPAPTPSKDVDLALMALKFAQGLRAA